MNQEITKAFHVRRANRIKECLGKGVFAGTGGEGWRCPAGDITRAPSPPAGSFGSRWAVHGPGLSATLGAAPPPGPHWAALPEPSSPPRAIPSTCVAVLRSLCWAGRGMWGWCLGTSCGVGPGWPRGACPVLNLTLCRPRRGFPRGRRDRAGAQAPADCRLRLDDGHVPGGFPGELRCRGEGTGMAVGVTSRPREDRLSWGCGCAGTGHVGPSCAHGVPVLSPGCGGGRRCQWRGRVCPCCSAHPAARDWPPSPCPTGLPAGHQLRLPARRPRLPLHRRLHPHARPGRHGAPHPHQPPLPAPAAGAHR